MFLPHAINSETVTLDNKHQLNVPSTGRHYKFFIIVHYHNYGCSDSEVSVLHEYDLL